jgi:hypothetical protein
MLTDSDHADGGRFHFTDTFRYLGVTLSSCTNDDADVDSRVAKASGAFACLSGVFLSSRIKPHAKRAAYVGTILPIILYGAEAWCLTEGIFESSTITALAVCVES